LTSNPDPKAERKSADDALRIGGKVRRPIDEKRNVLIARNSQAQASSQPDDVRPIAPRPQWKERRKTNFRSAPSHAGVARQAFVP
jgi:hypothetical protein